MNAQERIILGELVQVGFTWAVGAAEKHMQKRIGEATPHEMREAVAALRAKVEGIEIADTDETLGIDEGAPAEGE